MKLLVVDDSIVYRMAITQALASVNGLEVIGSASNGKIAVDMIQKDPSIDVVTLDMEMPVMDGMEAIKEIRKFNKKIIIIVFSSLTVKGAEKTIEALNLGANDFVTKEEASGGTALDMDRSLEMIAQTLTPKIHAFKKVLENKAERPSENPSVSTASPRPSTGLGLGAEGSFMSQMPKAPSLICMASSTGGPEALRTIVRSITQPCNVPILLVQHMPPLFTAKLAEMLNNTSPHIIVKEAEEGEQMQNGVMYIAPGGLHMTLDRDMKLRMNEGEKVSFVRPSATVLFESVAKVYDHQVLSIVLTGMGDDGAKGLIPLVDNGSYLYIQDEPSSIVWGMPSAAHREFPNVRQLPLTGFGELLDSVFTRVKK